MGEQRTASKGRFAWFAALWIAGVVTLALLAVAIRTALRIVGAS